MDQKLSFIFSFRFQFFFLFRFCNQCFSHTETRKVEKCERCEWNSISKFKLLWSRWLCVFSSLLLFCVNATFVSLFVLHFFFSRSQYLAYSIYCICFFFIVIVYVFGDFNVICCCCFFSIAFFQLVFAIWIHHV